MSHEHMRDVVCVLDDDPNSRHQLEWLRANKDSVPLKGLIVCSEREHGHSQVCRNVPAFPAFCNPQNGACAVGTRTTSEAIDALKSALG